MTNAEKKLFLSTFAKIEALANEALKATQEGEKTHAQGDARNYLWNIVEVAEEARGQWWAE